MSTGNQIKEVSLWKNEQFVFRIRVLAFYLILIAVTLVTRHLALVLSISYGFQNSAAVSSFVVVGLGLSVYFLYSFTKFLKKASPDIFLNFNEIWIEWKSATLFNKVLYLTGLLSLPSSLNFIFVQIATLLNYLLK